MIDPLEVEQKVRELEKIALGAGDPITPMPTIDAALIDMPRTTLQHVSIPGVQPAVDSPTDASRRAEVPSGHRGPLNAKSFSAGAGNLPARASLPTGPRGKLSRRSFSAVPAEPVPEEAPPIVAPVAADPMEQKLAAIANALDVMNARIDATEARLNKDEDDLAMTPLLHMFPPYRTVFSAQPLDSDGTYLRWEQGPYLNDPITSPDDRCIRLAETGSDSLIEITRPGKYLILFHVEMTYYHTDVSPQDVNTTISFQFSTQSDAVIYPGCNITFYAPALPGLTYIRECASIHWVLDWEDHIDNNEFRVLANRVSKADIVPEASRLIIIGPVIHAPVYI